MRGFLEFNKSEKVIGFFSSIIGYCVFILVMDLISKPSNVSLLFKSFEIVSSYFFGFVWAFGIFGWFLGGILLITYLAVWFWFGGKIQRKFNFIK
jgi:hypothetical protein